MEIVNDADSQAEKPSDKPASEKTPNKPSQKPTADKSLEKPTADKPSEKPTADKPSDKPTSSKPTDKPTTTKPAINSTIGKPSDKLPSENATNNPVASIVKEIKEESTSKSEQASLKSPEVKSVRNRKQLLCQRDESLWKSEIECMEAFTQDDEDDR